MKESEEWAALEAESAERIRKADEEGSLLGRQKSISFGLGPQESVQEACCVLEQILNYLESEGQEVKLLGNSQVIVCKDWFIEKVQSTGQWLTKARSL